MLSFFSQKAYLTIIEKGIISVWDLLFIFNLLITWAVEANSAKVKILPDRFIPYFFWMFSTAKFDVLYISCTSSYNIVLKFFNY